MILEIKEYIKERKRVTVDDIAIHFQMDTSAVEPILEKLIQSSPITLLKSGQCSSCKKSCPFAGTKPLTVAVWEDC